METVKTKMKLIRLAAIAAGCGLSSPRRSNGEETEKVSATERLI